MKAWKGHATDHVRGHARSSGFGGGQCFGCFSFGDKDQGSVWGEVVRPDDVSGVRTSRAFVAGVLKRFVICYKYFKYFVICLKYFKNFFLICYKYFKYCFVCYEYFKNILNILLFITNILIILTQIENFN